MITRILLLLFFCTYSFSCKTNDGGLPRAEAETDEQLSGGENLTTQVLSDNAFGESPKGLSLDDNTAFVVGNSFFQNNWVSAPSSVQTLDGLGPIMNAISCSSCHLKDGRAKPPATADEALNGLLFRLSISGTDSHGGPLGDPAYGTQFQDKSVIDAKPEGNVRVTYENVNGNYADGTAYTLQKPKYEFYNLNYGDFQSDIHFSPRIAQQIPGLGLLENVSEQTILSFADENDSNGDGISGKANYVWDQVSQKIALGRFGWKANVASIRHQSAGAISGDIGITNSLFPDDDLTPVQKELYGSLPNGGDPEISDKNLDQIVFYCKTLAVPARRDWKTEDVLRGKLLFTQLNCSGCHIPAMQTGTDNTILLLNNQKIRPYTDLLVHDMGDGLADNRADFLANGKEWRTPPLWGIGMIKTVNKHTFLLHDGRARNAEEAILWHGGEAAKSQAGFIKLSESDRKALIKFLESL